MTAQQTVEITDKQIQSVQSSYGRCLCDEFFEDFYANFLSKSPEIGKMFANTDMTAQKGALRNGIAHLVSYAKGSAIAEQKVDELGKSHARDRINVPPTMYSLWLNSLIEAIQKHDKQYSPDVEAAWKAALSKGIDRMVSLY